MLTFCFKLYNSRRNRTLHRQINIAGIVYNHCLTLYRRYYRLYHKFLNKYQLRRHITKLKRLKRFSYWNQIPSHAIQDITDRIYRAYELFFSNLKRKVKASPPKFKKVKKYKSFSYNQPGKNLIMGNIIKLAGGYYKFFKSREIQGLVKIVTIKRDTLGDIYVYLVCDATVDTVEARSGEIVGFDFGLKKFLTSSDGKDIESPLFFKLNSRAIKRAHRKLSYTQRNSHNHERAMKNLARKYKKASNQRRDFHFKTALKICRDYALICIEDLNLKGMKKLWGRKVSDLGFYSFVKILEYEAMKSGSRVIKIDRYYPSSQICSVCSCKNPEVKDLRIRSWKCPSCGAEHDRDRNAAKNILRVGASTLAGDAVRPEQSGGVEDSTITRL